VPNTERKYRCVVAAPGATLIPTMAPPNNARPVAGNSSPAKE